MALDLILGIAGFALGLFSSAIGVTWYLANYSKAIEDNLKKYTDRQVKSSIVGLEIGTIEEQLKGFNKEITDIKMQHSLIIQRMDNDSKLRESNIKLVKAKIWELYQKNKKRALENKHYINLLIEDSNGMKQGLNRNGLKIRQNLLELEIENEKDTYIEPDNNDDASGFFSTTFLE